MRRFILGVLPFTLVFSGVMGCQGMQNVMNPTQVTSTTPQTVAQVQAEPYNGPKVRIAVMEFENKTGIKVKDEYTISGKGAQRTVGDPIGEGMKEQLVTAIAQTGAFILLERQAIQDVLKEQEFGASWPGKKGDSDQNRRG